MMQTAEHWPSSHWPPTLRSAGTGVSRRRVRCGLSS